MEDLKNIVLLIDADNTQMSKLEGIIREISAYGRIVVKRAYGNWTKYSLKHWEEKLQQLAIKAEHQFDYVRGKNATDIALVIDALTLLHTNLYDAFVIVSSDCDFTPLAINLRESGVHVIGIGESKTPRSFRNSCEEFILLENIQADYEPIRHTPEGFAPENRDAGEENLSIEKVHELLKRVYYELPQDPDAPEGFVNICQVTERIRRAEPDFDVRSYGFLKLPDLLDAFPDKYSVLRHPGKGKVTVVTYRLKEAATQKRAPVSYNRAPLQEQRPSMERLHWLLRRAHDMLPQDPEAPKGFVNICQVAKCAREFEPDFDVQDYGFTKLPELLEAFPDRYCTFRHPGKGNVTVIAFKCNDVPGEKCADSFSLISCDGNLLPVDERVHWLLRQAHDELPQDPEAPAGYVNICQVADRIRQYDPEFDVRNYGYCKLPQMLEAYPNRYSLFRHPGKGSAVVVTYACIGAQTLDADVPYADTFYDALDNQYFGPCESEDLESTREGPELTNPTTSKKRLHPCKRA